MSVLLFRDAYLNFILWKVTWESKMGFGRAHQALLYQDTFVKTL